MGRTLVQSCLNTVGYSIAGQHQNFTSQDVSTKYPDENLDVNYYFLDILDVAHSKIMQNICIVWQSWI